VKQTTQQAMKSAHSILSSPSQTLLWISRLKGKT